MGKLRHCLRGWLWSLGFGPWKIKSRCGGLQRCAQDRHPDNSFLNYYHILLPYFSHLFFFSPFLMDKCSQYPSRLCILWQLCFTESSAACFPGPSPSPKPMTGERYPSSSRFHPVPLCARGNQRPALLRCFSPSATWVQGIKLRLSTLPTEASF